MTFRGIKLQLWRSHMAVRICPVSEVNLKSRGGSPKFEAVHTLP